jgi:cytosine/adenosine deaminase-related metal-dependent hydrolase
VETKTAALSAIDRFGMTATAKLSEAGLLGERTVLAHAVWVTNDDLELIASSGSTISYDPISNLKLGAGIAPVLEMREAGCNIALGSDGSASSDNQNMFAVMRTAAVLSRGLEPDYRRWLTAADVVAMATVNGAAGAGYDGEVGAIQPGYLADMVVLDLRTPYFNPRNDLLAQLVHSEVGSSVRSVIIDGRVVVEDGRVITVDEQSLFEEATEISHRITRDNAGIVPTLVPYLERVLGTMAADAWKPR